MAARLETPLVFAREVSAKANADWESGRFLDAVTDTTRGLLKWWFHEAHAGLRAQNFHEGQRQAILNVIWLHEVVKAGSPAEAYQAVAPDLLLQQDLGLEQLAKDKYQHPKSCVKMATGTGKTWVLQALLIWQYLNAKRGEPGNFSKHFLVVAPGLIVYERLLDAFLGKAAESGGTRDFAQADIAKFQDLFLPEEYRPEVFGFLQSCVARKDEIGSKVTGDGLVAVTNWHLLAGTEEDVTEHQPGADVDTAALVSDILPARPGRNAGNDLNALDAEFGRGKELEFLKGLPDLVVFNDEAHHIHEMKRAGEASEVEWQKSLTAIAEGKGNRFIQIDFSATPYNERGGKKRYFPHIVADFDLKTAIQHGLVKLLALDRRKEIASLELDFKAERDEDGKVIGLSEGQRVMIRAGLTKLRILEKHFTALDKGGDKYPKMMVVCEDTEVAPLVTQFLQQEGLAADDVLEIHTTKKGEVGVEEWEKLKGQLFNLDRHERPRVVVSVLMLREGFDVNNICVIVPLRSARAPILLEQTIGRGLRLMWRDPEFAELKAESRKKLLIDRREPANYLDILSIVEHPSFIEFYEELMAQGLVGVDERDLEKAKSTDITGDLETVGLRDGYETYDIGFPVIARESEDLFKPQALDASDMRAFGGFSLGQLKGMVPKNDEFISQEATKGTQGGCDPDHAVARTSFRCVSA
jgi:type III restriction enzyme